MKSGKRENTQCALFFLLISSLPLLTSVSIARADDISGFDQTVTDAVLRNAVHGAEYIQTAVSESSMHPCSVNGNTTASRVLPEFLGRGVLVVTQPQPGDAATPAFSGDRGGHAFAIFGTGRASVGGDMKGRALQLDFGQNITDHARVDVVHNNEGHPYNNHRDGFAMEGWYLQPVNRDMRAEFGVGPYFSMNTTTPPNGHQIDDKRLGALVSAALLYRIKNTDTSLRAQFNHVNMPGGPTTNAVLVGIGTDFNGSSHSLHPSDADGKTEVGAWGGTSNTNRGGSEAKYGSQVEARRSDGDSKAYSVSLVNEGHGELVNRAGVAAQVWYVRPMDNQTTFSAGIGPYVAKNRPSPFNDTRTDVMGLVSIEASRKIGKETSVSFRFNRVASSYNKDQDMFMIGFSKNY